MQFGLHEQHRDLEAIATTLSACHLVVLQEVRVGAGDQPVKALETALGDGWTSLQSSEAGFDEAYAILVRAPVRLTSEWRFIDAPKGLYARIPASIGVAAGDLDMELVAVHMSWRNKERRADEVEHLADWLQAQHEEHDVLALGDFNRYGNGGWGFGVLTDLGAQGILRIPFEELLADRSQAEAGHDLESTTVGVRKWQYDQFVATPGLSHELAANLAFGRDVGVFAFDTEAEFSGMNHHHLKKRMSDHRPIWLRLFIRRGDDD